MYLVDLACYSLILIFPIYLNINTMKNLILVASILFLSFNGKAQTYATRIVKDKLFIPWEIIYGPDNHIWLTQKNGYVCRLNPTDGKLDTLLYQSDCVAMGEGGMLGMALHPDFTDTPYVYFVYEYLKGADYTERVIRYTYSTDTLISPLILLDNIKGASIHNGARLVIADKKLFISTGDAAVPSLAQNVSSLNGKTLRINLDGTIPADNPIAGSAVWNWGQRNAQGLVFAKNRLYSSMHGANTEDEINIETKAGNYGWPTVEGYCDKASETSFCVDSNVIEPLITWTPTIAPSGMDYYEHPMFPALNNSLLLTTLKNMKLHQLKLNSTYDSIIASTVLPTPGISGYRFRDICISPNGSIFISTSNSNTSSGPKDIIFELYDADKTSIQGKNPAMAISISPNPAKEELLIRLDNAQKQNFTYEILGLDGRSYIQGTFDHSELSLDVKALSSGIYIFRCYNENTMQYFNEKIVKY